MLLCWMMVATVIAVDKGYCQLTEYKPKNEFLCRNFTEGNLRLKEFYSPNYPSDYPPKIECILVLKADFGYFVRVDFRDQFTLEPSDSCDHDFLEVRDGGHGYSPLIGRFCGRNFPPIITSSDRALWLRFSSDETIEYSGFRAVYQYIPNTAIDRPDYGPCRFDLEGYEGVLGTKDILPGLRNYSVTYDTAIDCTWTITVEPGYLVQVTFPSYRLQEPNECDVNFLDVFGSTTDLRNRIKRFCGSVVDTVSSVSNILHIRFYAEPKAIRSKFEAIFTAYRNHDGFSVILSLNINDKNLDKTTTPFGSTAIGNIDDNLHAMLVSVSIEPCRSLLTVHYPELFETGNRAAEDFNSSLAQEFTTYRPNIIWKSFTRGSCFLDEFDCEDARCIPLALKCNGRFNCRQKFDEEGCKKKTMSFLAKASKDLIMIMVIGILLVLGICGACLYNCFSKLRQDHRTYKARRSRSREDRLDETARSILEGSRTNLQSIQRDKYNEQKVNGHPPSETGAANGEITYIAAEVEYDDESDAHVEMVDCEVQTRDSLFRESGRTSNSSDSHKPGWMPTFMRSAEPPRSGWTATPLRSALFPLQKSPLIRYGHPRDDFRSEAVIEMAEQSKGRADVLAKM